MFKLKYLLVINQCYTTGYKPKNYLVVTMDTDEDEDTMNSDDATAKTNIKLDHNYAPQPSQFPHPQPPPQHSHLDPPCPDRVCFGQQKEVGCILSVSNNYQPLDISYA